MLSGLRADTYDIVLLDNNMPVMSGLDALKLIKKRQECTGRCAIALSSHFAVRFRCHV